MNDHVDMRHYIAPKSDQLNADDLIGGTRTVTISHVNANEASPEQPINIFFQGDGGKPFRPCKSMRRVMVAVWGPDASRYVGRSMTLYRDPKVQFGGMAVGGIRISHMSHITERQTMALTASKAKRAPYTVEPLRDAPEARGNGGGTGGTNEPDRATLGAQRLVARIQAADSAGALVEITEDHRVIEQRGWLSANRPDLAKLVDDALAAGPAAPPADADDFPA